MPSKGSQQTKIFTKENVVVSFDSKFENVFCGIFSNLADKFLKPLKRIISRFEMAVKILFYTK